MGPAVIGTWPGDMHSHLTWIRLGIAGVWFLFGLIFKALGFLPRHRQVVVRVVGPQRAATVLWLVVVAESGLGMWMLLGRWLPLCMVVQTLLIASMNTLELRRARDLLISPWGMVCANAVFLSLGWYVSVSAP